MGTRLLLWFGVAWLAGAARAQGSGESAVWNQPRGNAAGTAALALEGVHAQPVEEWRQALDEILCEPVVWGGAVFTVCQKGGERRLVAFRVQGGEPQGQVRLGRGGPVELAVSGGTVVVVDGNKLRSFSHRGGQLKLAKQLALERPLSSPCVYGGRLFVADGSELHAVDVQSLKLIGSVPGGEGRPALELGEREATLATFTVVSPLDRSGTLLKLCFATLRDEAKGPKFVAAGSQDLGQVSREPGSGAGHMLALGVQQGLSLWYVRSPRPLLSQDGKALHACLSNGKLAPITSDAVACDGNLYGFDEQGALLRFAFDGRYGKVLERSAFPPGARPGAATSTRDVLYLGNWALEIESGRVLWCLAAVEPRTPLVPTENGRLVVGTAAGELVGYLDPNRAATAAPAESAPVALVRPDAENAVVLVGGEVVSGPLTRAADGTLSVPGEDGAARGLSEAEIAFASAGGKRVGPLEHPVYLAWRAVLEGEVADALAELALDCARDRHVADAQRLLAEALASGLPAARRRALDDVLAGKAENKAANATAKLEKRHAAEHERRLQLLESFAAAADWCAKRDLDSAGSALLARARRLLPDEAPALLEERAAALVPSEFPWAEAPHAAQRWLDWVEELLPAEAVFLDRDERGWSELPAGWKEKAIGLRTRNLAVFTPVDDPRVIGPCLRKGEGTLRVLEELLTPAASGTSAPQPLKVLLFADRDAFLREGGAAIAWSAGYYSPGEMVSRFYVSRDEERDALERELASTFAHELTHHWLDVRWLPLRPGDQPGYWIVEGFARFVEDQVLELGRADRGFEDATVRSVDLAAQALKKGLSLPLARILELNYSGFQGLANTPRGELELRYTLGRLKPSERALFYEQSAALVFFLMNRCGEKGRTALLDYLRAYHGGKTTPQAWKALGWESAGALQEELDAFLRSVAE